MSSFSLALDRIGLELRQYTREKEDVFFTFLFPLLMLVLFATIFAGQFTDSGMSAGRAFLPGMIAAGVFLTSFQSTAMSVTTERDNGTLRRVAATPLPLATYFWGKAGLVLVTSFAQLVALLAIGRLAYGVPLPSDGQWGTLAWVFVLGIVCGTALGVAYSSLVPSARTAVAMIIAPVIVLQFISGVYFPFDQLPDWLQQVATIFPLKWIAQGMRSVFYPPEAVSQEIAGSWEHGRIALVVLAWTIAALIIAIRTFRWQQRDR